MGFELGSEHSAPLLLGCTVWRHFLCPKSAAPKVVCSGPEPITFEATLVWKAIQTENDFVTIWTNPTEPVLKLCFTLFEATSSTILCIGLSFTSQNYQNWEPELYLFRLLTYVSCIIALPKCGQNFRRSVDPTEKNLAEESQPKHWINTFKNAILK